MANIRSYDSPQQQASGEGLNEINDARFAGTQARATMQAVDAGTNLIDTVYERQAQTEISDLNYNLSKAREDWTLKLQDQVRTGTVDVEKLRTDYQAQMDKVSDGITTPKAQDFFHKQSLRLQGSLMKTAALGQAHVAGAKAVTDYTEATNSNISTLHNNPSDFQDIYDSQSEALDAQVKAGAIDFQTAEKLKKSTGAQLAEASIRGYAKQNPDTAEEVLKSGQYDKYLDERSLNEVMGNINQQRLAKEMEQRRAQAAQEKAQKLKSDAWQNQNVQSLMTGGLKTQDIFDSPMNSDEKIRWIKLQDEAIKDTAKTDPREKNNVTAKIVSGEYTDMTQFSDKVGKGLSITDFEQLTGLMNKLPTTAAINTQRKILLDTARATILKKDPITGFLQTDGDSEYNLSVFTDQLLDKEAEMRKEKKPVSSLYDPNSKDYFGRDINKYKLTPQQIIDRKAEVMRKAVSIPDEDTVDVISPAGVPGKLPRANLEKAMAQGYRKAVNGR